LKAGNLTLSEADQKLVLAVLEKNRVSGEKEDMAALKSTYDAVYPDLDVKMDRLKQLFAAYDLKLTVTNIKFLDNKDDVVRVSSSSLLEKVSGPEFVNLLGDSIETLKKNKDGEWKIIKSDDLSVEFIR
jgi:hypothetical protein